MKKYQPQKFEKSLYEKWESKDYFAPNGNGTPFCIMIPPPNVTGTLHMGHAFQHSLVDAIIRYKRMKGNKTLWQMGMDHAGIATQMLVTERLLAEGIKPNDIGREAFIETAWDWKEHSGAAIATQLRRLGASLHWDTERFTLDERLSKAVLEVFVQLYDEGLIYKGERLVNWDPHFQTSISDLEVESEEEDGHLWHFKYPLVDSPVDGFEHLIVATTRPETMLGDTAVAVHPSDDRYRGLVGRKVELPLTGRQIPIIADHYVDQEFGTGCVKITPAHDFNDYEVGSRNDLPLINVFHEDASLNENAPQAYQGMDRFEARKQIVKDLQALGLVEKIEPHRLAVPRGERSGVVIEPYLSEQWFLKTKALAEPAIKVVEDGEIEFIPKNFENTYFAWMREIQDWNISRQQWWGHRIPAWYDDEENVYVGRSEEEVRQKYGLADALPLSQDEDVLDTWFSSALWTFSTLGWPDQTEEIDTFHSTDVMVTGYDIIPLWVSRMIMMTLKFMGEVPFKKVYVTGLVTDAHGQKMSKSKGNGLDPLDIIEGISADDLAAKRTDSLMQPRMAKRIAAATRKEFPHGIKDYGTDALRFTFYSIATRSRTVRFDMKRVEGYGNFCNKLWNAANFVAINTDGQDCGQQGDERLGAAGVSLQLSVVDKWIISTLQHTISAVNEAMESFRFDLASKAIYEFIWDEFCDWYLEFSKPILNPRHNLNQPTAAQLRGTRHTLVNTLETALRLAHPFMPFITEEIWLDLVPKTTMMGDTIMLQLFPEPNESLIDKASVEDIEWVKDVVNGTRNIRGEMNISLGRKIPVVFMGGDDQDLRRFNDHTALLEFLIKPESLTWLKDEAAPVSATHLVGDMQVLVPMSGLIDKEAELSRLSKEIDRRQTDIARGKARIANPNFVEKAPSEIVQKEKDKVVELGAALEQLKRQHERISGL